MSRGILSKLKRLIVVEPPMPPLESGEAAVREGRILLRGGLFGGSVARFTITNRRLIWDELNNAWPMKPTAGQIALSEVESVDRGGPLEFLLVVRGAMRVRPRDGRDKCFVGNRPDADEWITATTNLMPHVEPAPGAELLLPVPPRLRSGLLLAAVTASIGFIVSFAGMFLVFALTVFADALFMTQERGHRLAVRVRKRPPLRMALVIAANALLLALVALAFTRIPQSLIHYFWL